MKTFQYPPEEQWESLRERPGKDSDELEKTVKGILEDVKNGKDKSLLHYSALFDSASYTELKVSEKEISESEKEVPETLKLAIKIALKNIEKFHSSQLKEEPVVEISSGVKCWRKNVAIERVGLYIPGGSAPLFSTLLMLAVPAKIAGCRKIIVCTPAGKDGKISSVTLYTANLLGISEIYKVGGAQAIGAMAYGTETIPAVDKIFGPGNRYVTKAKELVQLDGVAIDMPAGPSEVLVIADKYANPSFIAADLIAQAEHGPDSQVILATDDSGIIDSVRIQLEKQVSVLGRKDILERSLEHAMLLLFKSTEECIAFSNCYAPEHLIMNTSTAETDAGQVTSAGSVFLGQYSCESLGDYASGTNHTLPTNGFARNYSGLSTESFVKKITYQNISKEGIKDLGPVVELMAEAESLEGHKNAVTIRLKELSDDRAK